MIEELTKEQEVKLEEFKEHCLQIGLSTERIDRTKNQEEIDYIYKKFLKLKSPKIWYVESPLQYNYVINILNSLGRDIEEEDLKEAMINTEEKFQKIEKSDRIFHNIYWSNADIYWIGFFMFPHKYMDFDYGEEENKDLKIFYNLMQNVGYLFFHEDVCFISERPIEIYKKETILHNENGPSVSFSDGYKLWHLNGVEVTEEIVMTPADEMTPDIIINEANAEIRKEILKKMGIERVIKQTKADIRETKNEYTLYELESKDTNNNPYIYLKMDNPSTDEIHFERVHPNCNTIEEALAYRDGEERYVKPDILT